MQLDVKGIVPENSLVQDRHDLGMHQVRRGAHRRHPGVVVCTGHERSDVGKDFQRKDRGRLLSHEKLHQTGFFNWVLVSLPLTYTILPNQVNLFGKRRRILEK